MAQVKLTAPAWDCDELREALRPYVRLRVTERTTGWPFFRKTVFTVSGEEEHIARMLAEYDSLLRERKEREAW